MAGCETKFEKFNTTKVMNWIPENTSLIGTYVELLPLEEKHFDELSLLSNDARIWEFTSADMSTSEKRKATFGEALKLKATGNQHPFVIYHKIEKKLIGATRLMDLHPEHRKLEIGWTWLHPSYWASHINFECKLLLLNYSFEVLNTVRVQLKTDEKNLRSQKAIQKIGGIYEGIWRQDWIRDNGTLRNTVFFSILDKEWKGAKFNLEKLLQQKIKAYESL